MIWTDGRLLLCRRPLHKRHGGLWEFPGGKLRPGETLATAVERELAEELDLDVLQVAEESTPIADDGSELIIEFVETEVRGIPRPSEHLAMEWDHTSGTATYSLTPAEVSSFFR